MRHRVQHRLSQELLTKTTVSFTVSRRAPEHVENLLHFELFIVDSTEITTDRITAWVRSPLQDKEQWPCSVRRPNAQPELPEGRGRADNGIDLESSRQARRGRASKEQRTLSLERTNSPSCCDWPTYHTTMTYRIRFLPGYRPKYEVSKRDERRLVVPPIAALLVR
jgi:hypothetical protein